MPKPPYSPSDPSSAAIPESVETRLQVVPPFVVAAKLLKVSYSLVETVSTQSVAVVHSRRGPTRVPFPREAIGEGTDHEAPPLVVTEEDRATVLVSSPTTMQSSGAQHDSPPGLTSGDAVVLAQLLPASAVTYSFAPRIAMQNVEDPHDTGPDPPLSPPRREPTGVVSDHVLPPSVEVRRLPDKSNVSPLIPTAATQSVVLLGQDNPTMPAFVKPLGRLAKLHDAPPSAEVKMTSPPFPTPVVPSPKRTHLVVEAHESANSRPNVWGMPDD